MTQTKEYIKERPILFSGPMVRAILEGRKTQTRRVVKPQPDYVNSLGVPFFPNGKGPVDYRLCPYGKPGDQLWVREKFEVVRETCGYEVAEYDYFQWEEEIYGPPQEALKDKCPRGGERALILYAADEEEPVWRWKPSIYMPRWASRLTLEVTGVRVERLQEISNEDALAEGVLGDECLTGKPYFADQPLPCMCYANLWESINGPGSWDANPWVWVVEFRKI